MFCIKEVTAMSEETLFEKLGVKYIEKDGIFYPLITLGGEENSTDVGKYGRMWMDYIQKEYPQRYRSLVRFGELHDKATEVNKVAHELLEDIENEWLTQTKACEFFCGNVPATNSGENDSRGSSSA